MPPRIRLPSVVLLSPLRTATASQTVHVCLRCRYATAAAITPVQPVHQEISGIPQTTRYSSIQPPSHRDPKYRKSQLIRSYVSLLESTPLIILFQHNNLRATEWASIRRELANALQKVDDTLQTQGSDNVNLIADQIKLQVVQTNMLEPALRITEYYKPSVHASTTSGNVTPPVPDTIESEALDPSLTHALSRSAFKVSQQNKSIHPLTPILVGNIALLTFPSVSPQHLKAALSILTPQAPTFPAPTRRAQPSYHEAAVQDGLKKLMLLGARVDGQIFDMEGTRWIGGIQGGLDGLRAHLVHMLEGFGAGLAHTLESASRSVWFTMEGRRRQLEEEAHGSDSTATTTSDSNSTSTSTSSAST